MGEGSQRPGVRNSLQAADEVSRVSAPIERALEVLSRATRPRLLAYTNASDTFLASAVRLLILPVPMPWKSMVT